MNPESLKLRINQAHTFLFVPGDQPERITKALQSKSDAVIIDLEDAVRPMNKVPARDALALPERDANSPLIFIRVNAFGSPEFEGDLKRAIQLRVDGVVLPKFIPGLLSIEIDEAIAQIEKELQSTTPIQIIGLIESSSGVLGLLNSSPIPARVIRLAFGGADLYADLGISYSSGGPNTDLAMAALVVASVHSKLGAPIDTPHFALGDDAGLQERSLCAAKMGFGGKLCIHPNQLTTVQGAFQVKPEEIDWATKVIARWNEREEGSGALVVDFELIDEAMVKRARQILGLL